MLSKIKPVPRIIIIAVFVGALGVALNEGLNRFGPKTEDTGVTIENIQLGGEYALEKANEATSKAVPVAPTIETRELDASESRGMEFLLKEGK